MRDEIAMNVIEAARKWAYWTEGRLIIATRPAEEIALYDAVRQYEMREQREGK